MGLQIGSKIVIVDHRVNRAGWIASVELRRSLNIALDFYI